MFCSWAILYLEKSTNEIIFSTAVEIETLKHMETHTISDDIRLKVLERQVSIAFSDRETILYIFWGCISISICLLGYGFLNGTKKFSLDKMKQLRFNWKF
jgi:hypothetical protein